MSPEARIPRRRRITAALAIAGLTVAASGCTVANSRHGGYDPNTLRIVLSQEPPTLEPCESSLTSTGIVVRSNITEPLIERDPNSGDLQPLLATEWHQTSPTSGRLVRDGVTFSNGAPFTAKAPPTPSTEPSTRTQLQRRRLRLRRRQARAADPDDNTLVVSTKEPDPILLRISFVEMPAGHQHDREGPRAHRHRPLRDRDWEYGQKPFLKRNDTYWA
jgi:peptide/nickel transport system substrate-binding protein